MIGSSVTTTVMLGTALLGATSGVIGSFAVLRRRALVGDMLSHAALPGICLAFLVVGHRSLFALSLGALGTGLLGIALVALITHWTRTKEDAAIGIVLSTFFGAGVVLLSIIQQQSSGNQAGLDRYMFGETASMSPSDIQLISGAAIFVLLIVTFLFKEFQLLSFDIDFAAAQGWPTFALDLAMMGALAVVTIVGLPICGVILMAALVILPGAAARFWTDHLGRVLSIAALVGAAAGIVGTLLSSPLLERWLGFHPFGPGFDARTLPPGPLIVLAAAFIFLISLLFAPRHGVVARTIAELRLRSRIAREHLLRSLYEISEPRLPSLTLVDREQLFAQRHANRGLNRWWLNRLQQQGLIEERDTRIRLTPLGLGAAAEVTRTHRLWELFLVESAGIAHDHVDRDADDVEHMLPAPLIRELEQRLAAAGRLPGIAHHVPESPHELD